MRSKPNSIDYCMMLSGELELILDGGETVNLNSGDIVVQRGTSMHGLIPIQARSASSSSA
jgi:uncharacterized cupin superfamily protein